MLADTMHGKTNGNTGPQLPRFRVHYWTCNEIATAKALQTTEPHHSKYEPFFIELLRLNLSVLLRKFILNIHLNQSVVVPCSGGRDYKINLVGSQPARLLHILVKST